MSSSPTEVTMPQMGVSVAEGTVAAWHKRVGDRVAADETICEISTDKIDTDVPAPAAGRVVAVLVAEGKTVAVGTVLAEIETDARGGRGLWGRRRRRAGSGLPAACAPSRGGPAATDRRRSGRPDYSPVVARIAAEHGIDLATIGGTGRDGRVRKQDVLAAVEAGGAAVPDSGAAGTTAAAPAASPSA